MAGWKKIIHSGSDAHLNDLYLSGDIIHAGDTDTKIQFNTDIINFDTAGTERIRITAGGDVGIGTDEPAVKLDVAGDAQLQGTAPRFVMKETGGNDDFSLKVQTDGRFGVFNNNLASEVLTIEQGGDVGIGTTSPSNKLHVSGSIRISNSGDTNLILDSYNGTNDDSIIDFRENSVKRALVYWDGAANDFVISSSLGDFHLLPAGNVGIGTSSPSRKLHIETSGADGSLKLYQGTYQQFDFKYDETYHSTMMFGHFGELQYDGNGGYLRLSNNSTQAGSHIALRTAGSERIRVTHDGNVGIGTSSPNATLEVNGNVKATSFTGSLSGSVSHALVADSVTDATLLSQSNLWYNGTTYLSSSVNVNVEGHVSASKLLGNAPNGDVLSLQLGRTDNANYWSFNHAGNDLRIYNTAGTDSDILLGVDAGGTAIANKVGIGTATPDSLLHLASATGTTLTLEDTDTSIGIDSLIADISFVGGEIGGETARIGAVSETDSGEAGLRFYTGQTVAERLRIDKDGNVGIGTTTPSGPLHVKGSTNDTVVYIDTDDNAIGDSAKISFNGSRAHIGWIDSAVTLTDGGGNKDIKLKVDNASILLQTSDTTRMFVSASGKVGIGTTSPATKLDVNGITTGLGFQTNTANTNYNLISRNSSGNAALYVQKANSGTNEPIARFNYGSSTANAGSQVLNVQKDKSYFDNTNLGIGNTNPPKTLTVQGDISGSGDLYTAGNHIIGGSTAHIGYQIVEDQIVVRSGSSIFGHDTDPAEAFHQFTGSVSITGSLIVTGNVTGNSDTATVATTVTITDNESTNENNALIFTAGGAVAGGNLGLESDGTLTYNPSTGKVTATGFIGTLTGTADSAVTVGTTPTNNNAMDFNIGMFTGTSGNQYMMVDNNGGLQYNPSTNTLTVPNISANLTGDVTGDLTGNADSANFAQNALDAVNATNAANATKVNINNKDTGDTNCPILFTLDSSAGFKSVFEDNALYFDATNNILYSTTFSGALTGTATNATNVKVTADSGDAEHPITFIDDTSPDGGNESLKADAAFKYNPGTDTLTVGKLLLNSLEAGNSSDSIVVQDSSGNLKTANLLTTDNAGNLAALFAQTATNAQHVNLSTTAASNNYPIPFQFGTSTAAGNFAMAKDSVNSFTYNPSTNTLTVPNIVGNLTGTADTATSATNADNADTVDDLHAHQFLRSDQDDTATGDITFTGDIYGRSVNSSYSRLYRMGGIFFTWDSDTYGTQLNHSITSTDNGTYSDDITINSYGHVRINIDSNGNGTNTFSIGRHTTGTANTLLTLNESGILSVGDLQLTSLSAQNSENTSLMIDGSGNVGTRELGSNAFNSTTIPTNNNQLTNGAGYITSGDVDGFTETEIEITMAREAGWEPAYGSATESNVIWDQTEDAIKIYSPTDNSIGAAFRAVYMSAGETKRFTTMIRGSVAAANGIFLRLYQHNGDMPNGKTHVSNHTGGSHAAVNSPFVQEDDTGITNWHDNSSVSTSWVTYEYDYTAVVDGYVSLVVLNWSGHGVNTLWVKTPDIQTVTMANATNADHVDIDTITSGIARLLVADHPGDNVVGSQDGYKQVYGEDALFWDGTNHQLGINCNPSFALEVAGEAHISGKVSCGNDISASGQIYATSVNIMDEIGHIGDSNTKIEFTSDDIEFYAGNRKMLRLNESSTDYVTMDTDYFQILNENSSDSTKFLFHVESGNNSTYNGNIYLSTDGMEIFTNSSVRKIMMGNNNRRTDLVINTNGDVGIGTSSPSANLEVYRNNSDTDKQFSINQDGDGDATQTFRLTGLQEYAMGIDHSDGDKFKISDGGSLGSSDRLTIDTNGDVGISKNSPAARLDIVGPDYNATLATSVLGLTSTGNALQWQFGVSNTYGTAGALYIEDDSSNQGIKLHPDFDGGDDDFRNLLTSFTGYHRSVPKEGDGNTNLYPIGTIVSSNGSYNNPNSRKRPISSSRPNISEAVPVIEMSNIAKDKKVFGVVWRYEYKGDDLDEPTGNICSFMGTGSEDRILVNSVGEGAIWVTNYSGNLENGDYITTSPIPGLGMKQDDDLLHNYTVAKITQDCDFQIDSDNYDCIEFERSGSTYRKAFVGCTYHCG